MKRILAPILGLALALCLAACSKEPTSSEDDASQLDLDRAVQAVSMAKGNVPSNVDELKEFLALQGKRVPAAPAGQRYVIDPTNRVVMLVAE